MSWKSSKQSIIALSTTEAEYIALCSATHAAMWFRSLLNSFHLKLSAPTRIYEDNQSTIAFSKNCKVHPQMKHIDIKFHYVRDMINKDIVALEYCPTQDMISDVLTKSLPRPAFEKCRMKMQVYKT